jgi:hypothetical protein
MRASPVTAVLFTLALLWLPAQTPRALHGATPDTTEVPERINHHQCELLARSGAAQSTVTASGPLPGAPRLDSETWVRAKHDRLHVQICATNSSEPKNGRARVP